MNEINPTVLLAAIELIKSGYRPQIMEQCIPVEAKGDPRAIQTVYVRMALYPDTYKVVYDELIRAFNIKDKV
jgi:hypothetical protein